MFPNVGISEQKNPWKPLGLSRGLHISASGDEEIRSKRLSVAIQTPEMTSKYHGKRKMC